MVYLLGGVTAGASAGQIIETRDGSNNVVEAFSYGARGPPDRGLFISVAGFRSKVAAQFDGRGVNIILIDGSDLIHVLEGRIDLRDALKTVIEKAAEESLVYTPLIGR